MIATVALEGRKGEMDACSNLIASEEAINEDRSERSVFKMFFVMLAIFRALLANLLEKKNLLQYDCVAGR